MVGFPWVSFLIVKSPALLFARRKLLTEDNGGKVLGTVSKKLDRLVVGESNPTKKKINKAKELKSKGFKIEVSNILEQTSFKNGFDLADYYFNIN